MTTPLPEFDTLISLTDANTIAGAFGKTVTQQQLSLAELCITIRTGFAISDPTVVDSMDQTDRYWMAQAVVLQAIWSQGQPDLLTRLDQSQAETDGDAITLNHDGILLAPLAKWAILRTSAMSWSTAEAVPVENVLGIGGRLHDPENIGWRRWHS